MPSHYFDENPESEFLTKEVSVTIDGRDVTVLTSGGIFSPDHIDTGTKVLLEHLALAPKGGDILDIGCGWGPIALSLASANPRATVWAIDVNERALELTRTNAARLGITNIKVVRPEEVPDNIVFSGVWSNPPIRVGKDALHEILSTWLPRLESGASAYLVVQKNLGSDSLQRWLSEHLPTLAVDRVDTSKSFRVLRATQN